MLLRVKYPISIILSKTTDYDKKLQKIESKKFTTFDYNKFMLPILHAKIKKKKELVINLIFLNL